MNHKYFELDENIWIEIIYTGSPRLNRTVYTVDKQYNLQVEEKSFSRLKNSDSISSMSVLESQKIDKIEHLISTIDFENLKDKYFDSSVKDGFGVVIRINHNEINKRVSNSNYSYSDIEYNKIREIINIITGIKLTIREERPVNRTPLVIQYWFPIFIISLNLWFLINSIF